MKNFSSIVNGKALEFTDSSVIYDGISYDFAMISDVKHRGGVSPAFIFDYNGNLSEIPYNPEDQAVVISYFKKAAATLPSTVDEEELISIDDMEASDSEPTNPVQSPEPVNIGSEGYSYTTNRSSDNQTPFTDTRSSAGYTDGSSQTSPPEIKFYQKTWFIVLLLIVFWPVGLYLMWKHANWKKPVKVIISCLVALSLLLFIIPSSSDNDVSNDTSYEVTEDDTTEPETTTEITTTEPTTTEPTTKAKEFSESDYESISYDNLARNPDDYIGKMITGSGKVIQVVEGDTENHLRVAINNDYDTVILLAYNPEIMDSRILEDDNVTYYGMSLGTYTYESTLGGNITVPSCYCDKIVIQ